VAASRIFPAGPRRCLKRTETTVAASRISPAGSHRCLKRAETAVAASRARSAATRVHLKGALPGQRLLRVTKPAIEAAETAAAGA
jgi:hypothetical protein